MPEAGVLILVAFVGLMIVLAIFSAISARKRREDLAALAGRLGLSFSPDSNSDMADRFGFLDGLAQGSNRYAFNVLQGSFNAHPVVAFDYHYETHSTDNKGRRQTHHHYFSCFVLTLPLSFPELRIYREGMFSKIGQFLGFDDIDFESAEFSSTYCVRSKEKKFAYDVCNPRMIEYLLANRDLNIEVEGNALALAFGSILSAAEIEANLGRLTEVRSRFPQYLFER